MSPLPSSSIILVVSADTFCVLSKDSGRQTSVFVEDTGDEYIADMLIAAGRHLGNSSLVNSIWFLCSDRDRHDS